MHPKALFRRLVVIGLCAFAGPIPLALPAAAQDGAAAFPYISERSAALSAQAAKSWKQNDRQLDLIAGRLNKTRAQRPDGENINTSSLAIRFTGRSEGDEKKSAALKTRDFLAPEKARQTDRFAVWFAGDVKVDSARANDPRLATVHTDGVTFGTDARLGPNLLVGNAIGAAFDRTGIGEDGSLGSRAVSDTLYASAFLSRDTYLDVVAGAAWTDFASRYGEDEVRGRRDARQLYAMARYSRKFRRGGLELRPYGEAGTSKTYFGSYGEHGTPGLAYGTQSAQSLHVSLGMRGETRFDTSVGTLRPHANLEVSRTAKRRSGAEIAWPGADDAYNLSPVVDRRDKVAATTGMGWAINDRATLNGEYTFSTDLAGFEPWQKISARFKLRF